MSFLTIPHTHLIWGNVFFYLFVGVVLLFVGFLFALLKVLKKKSSDMKLMQQQHVARIDNIRKEHTEKLEKLRMEMLKREEERSRQWMESEKETLHVLNGVSNLLDLSEKIEGVKSEKILDKLDEIQAKIEKLTQSEDKTPSHDKNRSTEGSE
jgi:hypothetical protein